MPCINHFNMTNFFKSVPIFGHENSNIKEINFDEGFFFKISDSNNFSQEKEIFLCKIGQACPM